MTFAQVAARNVHVWLMMALATSYHTDPWLVVLLCVWALADAPRSVSLPFVSFLDEKIAFDLDCYMLWSALIVGA